MTHTSNSTPEPTSPHFDADDTDTAATEESSVTDAPVDPVEKESARMRGLDSTRPDLA